MRLLEFTLYGKHMPFLTFTKKNHYSLAMWGIKASDRSLSCVCACPRQSIRADSRLGMD